MAWPVTFGELIKRLKDTKSDVTIVTKSGIVHKGRIGNIVAEFFEVILPDEGAGAPSVIIRTDAVDHIKAPNTAALNS